MPCVSPDGGSSYYAGLDRHTKDFTLCALTSEGQVVADHRRLPAALEPLTTVRHQLDGRGDGDDRGDVAMGLAARSLGGGRDSGGGSASAAGKADQPRAVQDGCDRRPPAGGVDPREPAAGELGIADNPREPPPSNPVRVPAGRGEASEARRREVWRARGTDREQRGAPDGRLTETCARLTRLLSEACLELTRPR